MSASQIERTMLKPTSWCVVRQQEKQYLIYNSKTDELHLIPPAGFYVYQLCKEQYTIDDIQAALAGIIREDQTLVREKLFEFLDSLIARGILETCHE